MNKLNFFINSLFFIGDFFESKIYPGFKIKRGEVVVDLGSGDKPFWRADVFLDKLALGNEQRFSSSDIIKDLGLFVDGDITKTPFKDKAFDFSFCSHVLEHIERPDLAIKEILRISDRGFIEVPDGMIEMMAPYQSHLWFVFFNNNQLIFLRKSKQMHSALEENNLKYQYLAKYLKKHFIRLYWRKDIKYKIIDKLPESEKFRAVNEEEIIQSFFIHKLYLNITSLLRNLRYVNNDINSLKKRVLKTRI